MCFGVPGGLLYFDAVFAGLILLFDCSSVLIWIGGCLTLFVVVWICWLYCWGLLVSLD